MLCLQTPRAGLCVCSAVQDAVDQYALDVLGAYAESFVQDIVMNASVKAATNDRLIKVKGAGCRFFEILMVLLSAEQLRCISPLQASQAAHAAETARIKAENERMAAAHTAEVEDKVFREERHRQVCARSAAAVQLRHAGL